MPRKNGYELGKSALLGGITGGGIGAIATTMTSRRTPEFIQKNLENPKTAKGLLKGVDKMAKASRINGQPPPISQNPALLTKGVLRGVQYGAGIATVNKAYKIYKNRNKKI
jgi:hypothetical protein